MWTYARATLIGPLNDSQWYMVGLCEKISDMDSLDSLLDETVEVIVILTGDVALQNKMSLAVYTDDPAVSDQHKMQEWVEMQRRRQNSRMSAGGGDV